MVRWLPGSGEPPAFLGSCFALHWTNRFVTAAHCIGDIPAKELAITTPRRAMTKGLYRVERHPTADIAALFTGGVEVAGDQVDPFWGIVSNWSLGEEFFAYGYPLDVLGVEPDRPTERLFRGHYQRFMRHRSHDGFEYLAAELSLPAPAGLSGGPLFRPPAPEMLVAMATGNLESTTSLERVEIEERPGHRVEKRFERVIAYGTALVLSDVEEWLNGLIPPRPPERRQEGPAAVAD